MLLNALGSAGIHCFSEYPLPFTQAGELDPKGCRMDIFIPHADLCVEVDDSKLHDPDRDLKRDQKLQDEFHIKTIRFTTDQIHRELAECVTQVKRLLNEQHLRPM